MMIATASVTSSAPPQAFFDRWAEVATWPEWNTDTEWVRLDGPFAAGTTGTLKPKGGPKVRFVVEQLTGETFVDVSRLLGARLTFDHRVAALPDGGTRVSVTVSLTGPLGRLWNAILGKGIAASVQPDLDRLAAACEQARLQA
jgi:hypothetical protein